MIIKNSFQGISVNPKIQGGMPVISGTRITVSEILGCFADGWTIERIEDTFKKTRSSINREQILSAVSFAEKQMRKGL